MATAYSTSSVPARRSIMEIEWTGVAMQVPMSGDHLGACHRVQQQPGELS
jgi:hypothetical protein